MRRCHIVPHQGEYTVGKHSYDAAMLLWVLHPNPRKQLLLAVMMHDCAERWVGDMPSPAKWHNARLGEEYETAEQAVHLKLGTAEILNSLSHAEQWWLLSVDRLELLLWAHDQMNMGNRHVHTFFPALRAWFDKFAADVPEEVRVFIREFNWDRTVCAEVGCG